MSSKDEQEFEDYKNRFPGTIEFLGKSVWTGTICYSCGAKCTEKKDLPRFIKRHPAKCQERKEFTRQLAEGVRSVEPEFDQYGRVKP